MKRGSSLYARIDDAPTSACEKSVYIGERDRASRRATAVLVLRKWRCIRK